MRVPLYIKVAPVYILFVMMFTAPNYGAVRAEENIIVTPPIVESSSKIDAVSTHSEEILMSVDMPSAEVLLPIVVGAVDEENRTWHVEDSVANYLPGTAMPGDPNGRVVLYAHDKKDGFTTIRKLNIGDKVYVTTNKARYSFSYKDSEIVSPTDVHVITGNNNINELVLITCDGLWSNNRYIVYLELEE